MTSIAAAPGEHRIEEETPGRAPVLTGQVSLSLVWHFPSDRRKRFGLTAVLEADEDGFVVTVAQLPGVVSEADEEREAIANIIEAAEGAIEAYLQLGEQIPWASSEQVAASLAEAQKCLAFTVEVDG
jgi:predicted RNase H-like HicB family nuclease